MHGKVPGYLDKDYIDVKLSFQQMKYTELKGNTERLVMTA